MLDVLVLFLAAAWPVIAFAALAVGVAWWSLFGDKPRGRRRCPRCWHDLSKTPGMTCGECGFVARRERQFARARRRWGLAASAVAATVAVAVVAQLSILGSTWPGYLPDAVIVRLPRIAGMVPLPKAAERELERRVARGALDSGELLDLVGAAARSGRAAGARDDALARALSDAVDALPEDLAPRQDDPVAVASARQAALAEWRRGMDAALARLPAWVSVELPARAPAGLPVPAAVRATAWGRASEWRIRPRGSPECLVGEGLAGIRAQPRAAPIDLPPADAQGRVRATLEFQRRDRRAEDGSWGTWTDLPPVEVDGTVLPLDAADFADAAGPGLDAAVRSAFDGPVVMWERGERAAAFRFSLRELAGPDRAGVLVGAVVELLEDGEPRRRLRFWCDCNDDRSAGWLVESEDGAALERLRALTAERAAGPAPLALPGWTVRIRSDRAAAARCLAGPRAPSGPVRAWSGSVEFPAQVVPDADSGPPRSYRLDYADRNP